MSPDYEPLTQDERGPPRASGDEPPVYTFLLFFRGSAPRERG